MKQFKIIRTGEMFFYDHTTNSLYDNNQRPLSLPFQPPSNWDELKGRFNSTTKSRSPETIKIILGHGCNYDCSYCLQKDIGDPTERPRNGGTTILLNNLRRLDLTSLTRIELWGGEPLLYWNDMVPIMEAMDSENITWYIPTNGTALGHKHLDFISQLRGNVAMGISHDGPGHEILRGKEFIHKKVDVFQRIQQDLNRKLQYSFNPVISKTNYDLFKINDFFSLFFDKHGLTRKQLSYEVGRVYDEASAINGTHHALTGDDLVKYSSILDSYLNEHLKQFKALGETTQGPLLANNLFHTGMGVLPYTRTLLHHSQPVMKTNCGADDSQLISVDMNGNVRTCQNAGPEHNAGNIFDIKGIKIRSVNFNREDHCNNCRVKVLCKSSCPIDIGTSTFETNCGVEKTHYSAIQTAAFKLLFNSDIEAVS